MLKILLFLLVHLAVVFGQNEVQKNILGQDYLLLMNKMTWEEGRNACKQKGFLLASIPNEQVNLKLAQEFKSGELYLSSAISMSTFPSFAFQIVVGMLRSVS